jgi:hypothetical protein
VSWKNGPWRLVARLTHLEARAQRRLWRGLILVWGLLLLSVWAALSAFTRAQEKRTEEIGQMYVTVAPLAAEVMDLREHRGQFEGQPPLLAAEQVAGSAGIGKDRLRIQLLGPPAVSPASPSASPPASAQTNATAPVQTLSLHAQGLSLRELVELLRDLRVEAGLSTQSAHLALSPGADDRMDLDLILSR